MMLMFCSFDFMIVFQASVVLSPLQCLTEASGIVKSKAIQREFVSVPFF